VTLASLIVLSTASPAGAKVSSAESANGASAPVVESGLPPRITTALKNLARRFSIAKLRSQYEEWSHDEVVEVAKEAVKQWLESKAKECPHPLLRKYFCSRPPELHWGRGLALGFGGRWPGEFYSPWVPRNPPRVLRPGVVFWLVCWSAGAPVNNGVFRSNLWYRLTNRLWVSDAWLDTGTNRRLPGVAHC
jgi:hypothetical protein